ncbi:hypothetical protein B0H14DRAFT_3437226 [Mycena olivaceomarginata]|nr:hypothetical protein B0H14DRAFT_3437226 [Mycena olivaceomarginata]
MDINALGVHCPEPACTRLLPAACKCQSGPNHGKWYTACFNEVHGPRYKFWPLGVVPNGLPPPAQPLAAHNPPPAHCASARRAVVSSPLCSVVSMSARARPPSPQPLASFPLPASKKQRLTAAQEAAARLAALTPLPPSPTLSSRSTRRGICRLPRPGDLTAAVGDHSRHPPCLARLLVHRLEASTTVVQDVAGWAQTWPTIHLQWVAIPQAYALAVVTDEPILLRRVNTVTDDQHEVIASFARFVDQSLYPIQLPALNRKHQHSTTPTSRAATSTSRQLTKKIKREHTYSSSDDLEVSKVTRMIKLEPVTPTARCCPSPGPPFTAVTYSLRRRLFSPSPPPVASSSRLPTLSSFETRRVTLIVPLPSYTVSVP